ncbi:glycoside hydrolase family 28 protein [Hirschia baltica]|uniref:Glycoside hydrolase family 28 n=1 Tax=Hirschia baltica (strain ATCC 49814 / DSM 5838 / IFAM 1418) TaxID=582402 RepID=C6XQD7_HIRBI|nr:glycoside hydrolase family 28 protein [Hirschia baltica]ACT60436.1 glycoside hydrolase family 28 [Hirschia baltica ATCC 49814]
MLNSISRRSFMYASAFCGVSACQTNLPRAFADPVWEKAEQIRQKITPPSIPKAQFLLTDFDARGDGIFDNTAAFKAAIDACRKAGGGQIRVPDGHYLTGAIQLHSNIELNVSAGARLIFSTDPMDYPVVLTRYEGVEVMNYSPLIYARDAKNVAITGEGVLDGQASNEHWWPWCGAERFGWREGVGHQTPDRQALFEMAESGIPVEQRRFGPGHYLRPSFVEFYNCENVLVEDIHLKDSPFWNIHPVLSRNVIVRGVEVVGHGPNNDGCNPESVDHMLIENCYFDTGDDCIAIKSGRNADGRRVAVPSENILIRNCQMKAGHGGVVIGSEISGDVFNVYAEGCAMDSPDLWYMLRIKNNAMRGGVVENIHLRNIEVGQVARAVMICDFNYEEGINGPFTPVLRNVSMQSIAVKKAVRVLDSQGFAKAEIENISLKDCIFNGVSSPSLIAHTKDVALKNIYVNDALVSAL